MGYLNRYRVTYKIEKYFENCTNIDFIIVHVPEEQIIIEDELLELSRHYDSSLSRGSLPSTK